jgi:hypothetical protein
LTSVQCFLLRQINTEKTAQLTGSRSGWLLGAVTVVLPALFVGAIGSPIVTGKQFVASDLGNYYLPYRQFFSNSLKTGVPPYWCPNIVSGIFMHGEGHMGMMHPVQRVLYRYLPLRAAIPMEMLLWFGVLYSGAYLLFRKWGSSGLAASAGAFVVTFGGHALLWIIAPNALAVLSHVPWLLLAIHGMVQGTSGYRVAGWCMAAALLAASQLLLGFPQHVLDSILIEGGYLLCIAAPGQLLSRAALLISTKVAAGLIGAAQLLPTWAELQRSPRAAPTLAMLSVGSVHPYNLLQWMNPFVLKNRHFGDLNLHEFGIYCGVGTVLLFLWLCMSPLKSDLDGRLRGLFIALALVGIFLSLGEYNLVFPLYARLPVIGLFRCPGRYFFITSFAAAGAVAMSVDPFVSGAPLSRHVRRWLRTLAVGVASLALAVSVAALISGSPFDGMFSTAPKVFVGCAIAVLGCSLFWVAVEGGTVARTVFLAFVLADVGFYYLTHVLQLPTARNPTASLTLPPVPPPGPVYADPVDNRNLLMLDGYRLVDGYVALVQNSALGYESPVFRLLAGSKANEGPSGWELVPHPFDRVRLLSSVFVSADPARDADRVNLATTALALAPVAVDSGATGRAVVQEDSPGRVRIQTEGSGALLAALTERFDPGWTSRVDGEQVSVLRVNGDFLGVTVPTGHHMIELAFDPWELRWGIRVSLLGLALLGLYPTAAYFAERRRGHAR